MFDRQIFDLALTDAVLARASAFHRERAFGESFQEAFRSFDFTFIVHIETKRDMEIAVSNVTDNGADELAFIHVALRLGYAFSEPRDRHTNVGRERLCARTWRVR